MAGNSRLLYAEDLLEDTYAMAIGDAFASAQLSTYEWAQFAVATQLPPRSVRKEIDEVAQATVKALDPVSAESLAEGAQAPSHPRTSSISSRRPNSESPKMKTGKEFNLLAR